MMMSNKKIPSPQKKHSPSSLLGLVYLALLMSSMSSGVNAEEKSFNNPPISVLSYNVWHEGTQIPGGYDAIINDIAVLQPDLISLSEVRNYRDDFTSRLAKDLEQKGLHYYTYRSKNDVGVLSRYPITSWKDLDYFTRANMRINNVNVVLYSGHLDYLNYASVLPRGYDGNSYKPIQPVTDTAAVLRMNNASKRPAAVRQMIDDASNEVKKGSVIIVTGDFNEPSHQDWTQETRYEFDRNGAVIPWTSTMLLTNAGYLDTWRERYPDPGTHPGFTWVTADKSKKPADVTWTPKADERDRVDYIFYHPNPGITLDKVNILGPTHSITSDASGTRWVEESDSASIIPPQGVWPSDHKAVLATFTLNDGDKPEQKPLAVVPADFTVTENTESRGYELDGSQSKNAASYHWTIVDNGDGKFALQEKDKGPWVQEVKQAKARALIKKNTTGKAVYQLTVTGKDGSTDIKRVAVKISKADQTNNDQAFVNALTMSMQPADNGGSVTFSGSVASSSAATSTPAYQWTMPAGALEGSNGQAQQRFSVKKTSAVQNLKVKVKVSAGQASRELEHDIKVDAKDEGITAPAYDANKTYSKKCTSVSHNGKMWENQWYLNAGQEEPGKGGAWGGWREVGTSGNSCP